MLAGCGCGGQYSVREQQRYPDDERMLEGTPRGRKIAPDLQLGHRAQVRVCVLRACVIVYVWLCGCLLKDFAAENC